MKIMYMENIAKVAYLALSRHVCYQNVSLKFFERKLDC